jgi:putative transposase
MNLNKYGEIAKNEIFKTEELRKEIKIDEFVIMPNHLHLIIVIENDDNIDNLTVGNTGPCSLQ